MGAALAGPRARRRPHLSRQPEIYIPRNHLVEEALAAETDGDLGPMHRLVDAVTDPYRYLAQVSSGMKAPPLTASAATAPTAAPEVPHRIREPNRWPTRSDRGRR